MDVALKAGHNNLEHRIGGITKKKLLLTGAHVIFWMVFLSLPAMFNSRRNGMGLYRFVLDMQEPPRWANGLLFIAVFYFNSFIAIPRLYFRRRYLLLAFCISMSFSLFFLLNYLLMPPDVKFSPEFSPLGNSFNLFMFIIVYSFSFIICLYQQYEKSKEAELNTRISFLTAQINPHFLFNTLNSIYSLSLTKPAQAPDAIVKLSGMMRYSVNEGSQGFVACSKELDYIRNYVALQELRLTEEVSVRLHITGDEHNTMQIAPFLLIPFIENAFKHGVNGEDESCISITISISNNEFDMKVENTKVVVRQNRDAGTGLGVKTTKERLALLYPARHSLVITNDTALFTVALNIRYS